MSFLDHLGKSIAQSVDRAKFEADKFQKTSRVQGEIQRLQRELDNQFIELGQRAYDLQRAGQIHAPTVATMSSTVDRIRADIIKLEEQLKAMQAENYEAVPASLPPAQSIPITHIPSGQENLPPPLMQTPVPQQSSPTIPPTMSGKKNCPACGFQMPLHAVFCPNCGFRIGR